MEVTKLGSLENIMLPKGYKIEIYTDAVPNARAMDFAEDGTLFAGSMAEGKVYAVRPDRSVIIIDDSLEMPTGLDYYDGDLYVAEISRILKYENILQTMDKPPSPRLSSTKISRKTNGMGGSLSVSDLTANCMSRLERHAMFVFRIQSGMRG